MNFINRAIKNVTRKLSRTILLVLAFFLIGNLVIIGLGVSNATDDAKTLTRQKMRAVVTYETDYNQIDKYVSTITDQDELNAFYDDYPHVRLQDVKEIMNDSRISTANAFNTATAWIKDGYDYVHLNNEVEESLDSGNKQCYFDENGDQHCEVYVDPTHFIKANLFPNMIEFVDGDYELVDGRFYTQEEIDNGDLVLLVTKAFAEVNGLRVGDTYTVYTNAPYEQNYYAGLKVDESVYTKDFEIVGIFNHNQKILPGSSNYNYTYPYENPDNMLLMPATSLFLAQLEYSQIRFDYYANMYPDDEYYVPENRPTEDMDDMFISDVTFLLNDPLIVDDFVESYSEKLPQFMRLDANNDEFKRLAKPLDTLNLYANFIVWLVVINAIVIITLVTALTLKTREYEIGVLLSIGASKMKIVGQFFIELALVAILGFSLSIASGSLIANKVGQTVLEYQIQESEVNEEEDDYYYDYVSIWDSDYTTEVSMDDLVSEYNVQVSPIIIAEIYVLGLGIVFISIIIPSLMIMRFNPKKILMNQN